MSGKIIAMGGAVQLDGAALRAFYHSSGGQDAKIVIIPSASMFEDAGTEYVKAFEELGICTPAKILTIRQAGEADREEYIQAVQQSTGIFMGGGDQARLTGLIGGTRLHAEMLAAFRRGTTVAGSSAGTAALSSLMISRGFTGALPYGRIARFADGLGFISSVIFDQHFRQRNRLGRLIYAVTNNPGLLGVGVDENTAAVIEGDLLSVIGATTVTIVDGSSISDSDAAALTGREPLSVSDIRLHILSNGSVFDLQQRSARIARKAPVIQKEGALMGFPLQDFASVTRL